jgi:hypothetical protein
MFLYEYLTTLFWFTLGLVLMAIPLSCLQSAAPTLRVHRYFLKERISLTFWAWAFLAALCYAICQDIFTGIIIQLIILLVQSCGHYWNTCLRNQLLEEEMQYVQDKSDTPRVSIEESNLSTDAVWTFFFFYFIGLLGITAAIACQLFTYLYHPEEYLIGGSMVAMIVLWHFAFAFLIFGRLAYDDVPDVTALEQQSPCETVIPTKAEIQTCHPCESRGLADDVHVQRLDPCLRRGDGKNDFENRDEIYDKLLELRDGKKGTTLSLLILPLIVVWVAAWGFSCYAFCKTPFGETLTSRIDARRWWSDRNSGIDFRIITLAPESRIKIAASEGRDLFWTLVFTPVGFAGDDEGCSLYSELLRESLLLQTQDEAVKPTVEPMILAPDFLVIPFYTRLGKRDDAALYLENVVFGNQLEESTFDDAKTVVLEKLREQKSNADVCAAKFALAARRQVFNFGNENIVLFDDVEKADWQTFQTYYRNRFSQGQMPLVFKSGEQTTGVTLDEMQRQLNTFAIDAVQKRQLPQDKPGEYRATWDLDFPAIVATWLLPDPKRFPDDHGNALVAVKGLERQLLASKVETKIAAVHTGTFVGGEGLFVFISVVWEKETPPENLLAIFESQTGTLTAANSLPDWLKTERKDIAVSFDSYWWRWRDEMSWSTSDSMTRWGAAHYRYVLLLEGEEQYQTLAKSVSYANFYSVKRAFDKWLRKDYGTLVVLLPL